MGGKSVELMFTYRGRSSSSYVGEHCIRLFNSSYVGEHCIRLFKLAGIIIAECDTY